MKYLSLFSGIEAASVAWDPLGWEPLAFAEFAKSPSRVLAHQLTDVPNLGDVTAVDWEAWKAEHGSPDVMIAGSPCQAFSVAGRRRSLEDARGNLSLFTAELVRFLAPRYFVWENVPGVLNTDDNAFGCLLGELMGAGQPLTPPGGRWTDAGLVSGPERRAVWRVLDAEYLGVAQRRRRVFVVACPTDGPDPAKVLLELEGVRRHSAPSRGTGEGTAERIGLRAALEGIVRGGLSGDAVRGTVPFAVGPSGGAGADVAPTLDVKCKDGAVRNQIGAVVLQDARGMSKAQNGSGISTDDVAYTLDATTPQAVCVTGEVTHALTAEGHDASEDGTGRGTPIVLAQSAANAEIAYDHSTTLTCVHDGPPIVMAPAFSKRPGQQIATRDDDCSFALTGGGTSECRRGWL